MVVVLPLHTVYFSAWISWKPFMVLLGVLAGWDLIEGLQDRRWPWHPRLSLAFLGFLVAVAVGWPAHGLRERFIRLTLALVVGFLVLAVTEKRLRIPGMGDRTLRVIFWTAAAMALTGLIFSILLLGLGGNEVIDYLAGSRGHDLPLLDKVGKPAYLVSGFLAVSNWHQDPGYGAAWMVLWATLGLFASLRGLGTGRSMLDGAILGVLWASVVMVFSRTGWLALLIAVIVVIVTTRRHLHPRELGKRLGAAVAALVVTMALLFAVDVEGVGGELPLQFAFRLRQGWDLVASITGLFESSAAFEDQFNVSEQRADVWPEYFRLFLDNPLTGAGLGVGWETNSVGQEPHNLFLELGAETGVLGLIAFAVLMGTICSVSPPSGGRNGGAGRGAFSWDANEVARFRGARNEQPPRASIERPPPPSVAPPSGGRNPNLAWRNVGGVALAVSLLPVMTQTVLFEPTWWFAAGLFVAGRERLGIAHPPP